MGGKAMGADVRGHWLLATTVVARLPRVGARTIPRQRFSPGTAFLAIPSLVNPQFSATRLEAMFPAALLIEGGGWFSSQTNSGPV
jgi:hypothetical protein